MPTIVITDAEFPDLELERGLVEAAGIEFVAGDAHSPAELIELCRDADGIVNQYSMLTADVIAALPRCRVISRYGIGVNTIDVPAATAAGIVVGNVPDGSIEEVSDHAAALILASVRGVGRYNAAIRAGTWDYAVAKPLRRLRGRTVGLVGLGNIPRRLAQKLGGFNVELIGYDPFVSADVAASVGCRLVELDELVSSADVVSLHVPETEQTRGLISRALIATMKPGAIVVNTARGSVIDQDALVDALVDGRIAAAGLDVFAAEPLGADNPFADLPNVLLTPHMGWYSEDSEAEIRTKATQNAIDVVCDRWPRYVVNADVAPRRPLGRQDPS